MPSPLLDDDVAEPRKASATFAANCARCAWKMGESMLRRSQTTSSDIGWSAKILLRRASVALCKLHHESVKKRDDARGYSTQIGADGCPVDPRHPGGYEIFL